ncbi:hypothetical protein DB42_BS00250 [Neochlamydia sp. EPS4]|uniref:hypothetical protein n=1 Tax=Neochlamydia sp. EPS4 TaxID=1478175 RepID=UPI00058361DA|nr:hypothetical protein [Neochlamydia sp. EPS4]KIC73710.1 hypothetical protein DB42_BS00250 [Neochlamydia sp. EPS4]
MVNHDSSLPSLPRKSFTIIWRTLITSLLAVLIGIIFLPSILSTKWGNKQLERLINSHIVGKITFQRLTLSWFGEQTLADTLLFDHEEQKIGSLDKAAAKTPLWKLLINQGKNGNFELSGLNAEIIQYLEGRTNIHYALQAKNSPKISFEKKLLAISLKDMSLSTSLEKDKDNYIYISGHTVQGQQEGFFNLQASINNQKNSSKFFISPPFNSQPIGAIQLQVEARDFPVSLLDETITLLDPRYRGLLMAFFGETLNLQLHQTSSSEGIALGLDIKSPWVQGMISGLLKDDRILVKESDSIEINLQPHFVNLINQFVSEHNKFQLKQATKGHFNLNAMELVVASGKKSKNYIDVNNSYMQAKLVIDQADLSFSQPIGNISLKKFNLMLDALDKSSKIILNINSQILRNHSLTQMNFKGQLNKVFKPKIASLLKNAEMSLDLKGLPLLLVEEMSSHRHLLVDTLGQTFDAQINFSYKDSPLLALKFASDTLEMETIYLNFSPHLTLIEPTKINYQLPSSLLNKWGLHKYSLKSQELVPIEVILKKIEMPTLDIEGLRKATLAAQISIPQLNLTNFNNEGLLEVAHIQGEMEGEPLARSRTTFTAKLAPAPNNLYLKHLLGTEADLQLIADIENTPAGVMIEELKAEINSSLGQAQFSGRLENFEKLFLTSPATISYTLTPKALKALSLNSTSLEEPSKIYISMEVDKKGINFLDLTSSNFKGLIKIDQLNLSENAGAIHHLSLPWEVREVDNSIHLQIEGLTSLYSAHEEGSINGFIRLTNWRERGQLSFSKMQLKSKLQLVNFPVILLEKVSGYQDLSMLIGKSFNMDALIDLSNFNQPEGNMQLAWSGKGTKGQGDFKIQEGMVIAKSGSPCTAQFTLTPERFQVIRQRMLNPNKKSPHVILTDSSTILLDINSLAFPLHANDNPHWLKASITSHIYVDHLNIDDKSTPSHVWIKNIQGKVKSQQLAQSIAFSLKGDHGVVSDHSSLPFSVMGQMNHLFSSSGKLNTNHLTMSLEAQCKQFPVKALTQFASVGNLLPQRISAILGDYVNADVRIKIDRLHGPIIANLNGKRGSIALDATLKKGILTLNQDFHTQIALTPELGKYVLEDILPLTKGLIGSDNPLNINIKAEGFSLPIKNFDIKAIKVGAASLELGKVRFKKGGQLGSILSLFNTSKSDNICVWFTPLYINMQAGKMFFQRMDMLIMNSYPIATWGNVNLDKDRVDMTIGLTAQSLINGFNITGLAKDYMLQIPFKGKINNASIDTKRATAKIAALVAANRGPEGMLIGTALHIAAGGLKEGKAPAPTTLPLPWITENGTLSSEEIFPPNSSSSTHPLHKVEEKASSLLRNLLPF